MTRNVIRSVRDNVSAQMAIIEKMAQEVQSVHEQAESSNNDALRLLARRMAADLKALSEKAFDVGETVLDNAA